MLPSLSFIASRLRLKHIRLLVAIDDEGSILRAAKQVALSQPGATKALQEIEEALGETLFVRTNRGLNPNELGDCVIRYARLIYTDLAHLREEMAGIMEGYGGRVSIGMIMGAVPAASEMITKLMAKQPALSVQIVEDTSARLLQLLDDGRLDLAVCRPGISHHREAYESIKVREEQLAVVANIANPLATMNGLGLTELAHCPWIVYSANMPMRRYLEREFHELGLEFPTGLVETTSAFATLSLIHRNPAMVALMASDVAAFFQRFQMVSVLPLHLRSRSDPYHLVMRRDRTLSPAAQMLAEAFIRDPGAGETPGDQPGPAPFLGAGVAAFPA
ncbi:LysR family transcriptional regulator [Aquabacter spiritensis]|uniref:LysR family transcriptional regulator n=1 Tax=Aquabacter spiritensis TaxID=933073 RepID=A0A4R3LUI7_9HYPH|nr:LysR family transcriptional regulator [Aquabacter spiritensis]TCT04222.1 LysR family transcriptional regulator [Aquabacter spiritensis]